MKPTDPRRSHPDDILTAAYLDGTLPPEAKDRFELHLAECGGCRAGVSLLAGAEAETAIDAPREMLNRALAGAADGAGRRTWAPRAAAVAAAAILLVAGGLWVRSTLESPAARVERGGTSAMEALSPLPGAVVEPSRISFLWSAVAGADRYIVRIEDSEGLPVAEFTSRRAGEPIPWPAATPTPAPGRYLWSVRALALDRELAGTRPVAFEVR